MWFMPSYSKRQSVDDKNLNDFRKSANYQKKKNAKNQKGKPNLGLVTGLN